MKPHPIQLPEYQDVVTALQALANATGDGWLVTNVPLDLPDPAPGVPAQVDPAQPCLFCNRIH